MTRTELQVTGILLFFSGSLSASSVFHGTGSDVDGSLDATVTFSRKWRPHIATAAYSGVFTSFKNEPSTWIDVASPGVQHYGLKVAADVTSTNSVAIKMFVRVWVQFRNVF